MTTTHVEADLRLPLFRISVPRYHAMRDAGILGEDDRVELLDGLLVPKMTKKPSHRLATKLVREALGAALPSGFYVDSQEPITTGDSEPEPDVCIVRGAPRDYDDRHPGPADVPLVVEIADDSLGQDRGLKLALYARAGIAVCWIVSLRARALEVYSEPSGEDFTHRIEYDQTSVVPISIDGREVASVPVKSLLQ